MKRTVKLSEKILKEILNMADLSYAEGDEPYNSNQVFTSFIKKKGSLPQTTDKYAASVMNQPAYYAGGGNNLREEISPENTSPTIPTLEILDILNQRGIKADIESLVDNLNAIEDNRNEIIVASLNFILENVITNDIEPIYKDILKSKL